MATWPVRPTVVRGKAAKQLAFREATAALAASGTVTLELAVSGIPMAVAYRLDGISRVLRRVNRVVRFVNYTTMVLPNIILGERAIPDFLEEDVTPDKLADSVVPLLSDTPERRGQLDAFARLDDLMRLSDGALPSEKAAATVVEAARSGRPALAPPKR